MTLSKSVVLGSNPSAPATYKTFAATALRFYVAVACKSMIYYATPCMYYVYVLQSQKDKSLYIGYTTDLRKRFAEHNNGRNISTKPFRPYKLIFYESFLNIKDAKSREEYLKSGWGFRSIRKMLKNYFL